MWDRTAREALMSYELLFSAFIGSALAALGFLTLIAGILRWPKRRSVPVIALAGLFLMVAGIWLMYAKSSALPG
jgi:hypothetical protein